MTATAERSAEDKAAEKARIAARQAEVSAKEAKANEGKTGKGTRTFYGFTRGKGSQMISYEQWDESKPETLPEKVKEFLELTGISKLGQEESDRVALKYLITGHNEIMYSEASDPISEYVEKDWPEDVQKQFKLTVKNFAASANLDIEEVVNIVKPQVIKGLAAKTAA